MKTTQLLRMNLLNEMEEIQSRRQRVVTPGLRPSENAAASPVGAAVSVQSFDPRVSLKPMGPEFVKVPKTVKAARFTTTREEHKRWIGEMQSGRAVIADALKAPSALLDPRRFTGPLESQDFTGVVINLDSGSKYDWGPLLAKVNSDIYQRYFRRLQANQVVSPRGIEGLPAFTAAGTPSPTLAHLNWGYVQLGVQSMRFTNRFGGAVQFKLLPLEAFGIELCDTSSNLYVELKKWTLNLFLQPRKALFNTPAIAEGTIARHLFVEFEIQDSECYTRADGQRLVPHPAPTKADMSALTAAAAAEAVDLLKPLGLFALGLLHEKLLPNFEAVGQEVVEIYLSDNLCRFETRQKAPYVEVVLEVQYLGTGHLEGLWDNSAEVTAEPIMALLDATNWPVLRNERSRYIGSGTTTGALTMGYLSLEEAARMRKARVFPFLTEHDPILDDLNIPPGFEWDLSLDLGELENRAAGNNLGAVGPELFDTKEDMLVDDLYYSIRVRFNLVKF